MNNPDRKGYGDESPQLDWKHLYFRRRSEIATPGIRTEPNGPFGRSRLATSTELETLMRDAERYPQRYTRLFDGFGIAHDPETNVVAMPGLPLPAGEVSPNTLFVGCSGSEKTMRGIWPSIRHSIAAGNSLVVINVKGVRMTRAIRELAARSGRKHEVMLLAPRKPTRSLSWNPLEGCSDSAGAGAIASSLVYATTSRSEMSWAERDALEYLQHVILAVCTDLPENQRTLYTVRQVVLGEDYRGFALAHPGFLGLKCFANYDPHSNSNAATIAGALRGATRFIEDVAPFLSGGEVALSRFASEGGILILELEPHEIDEIPVVISLLLSRLIKALQIAACNSNTGRLKHKTIIAIDELAAGGRVTGLANALHICRELGFCFIAAVQSVAQLAIYGDSAKSVLAGFQTQVAMPGLDPESAEYFSRKSGTTTIAVPAVFGPDSEEDGGLATLRAWSFVPRPLLLPSDIASPTPHPLLGAPATLFLGDMKTPPFQAYLTPAYEVGQMEAIFEHVATMTSDEDCREVPLTVPKHQEGAVNPSIASALYTTMPYSVTDTRGWSDAQIENRLAEVKKSLDWDTTNGSARKWWLAFEHENSHRTAMVLRLAEELAARKATVTEFFLAYVYSGTDNIQAVLHYLDYTRLKKKDRNKAPQPDAGASGDTPTAVAESQAAPVQNQNEPADDSQVESTGGIDDALDADDTKNIIIIEDDWDEEQDWEEDWVEDEEDETGSYLVDWDEIDSRLDEC